jgi:dihydroorotate dehydrogenase electron transfer subunit
MGKSKKGQFCAAVSANRQIGKRFYRLSLDFEGAGAKAFGELLPGQFAEVDLSEAALPVMEKIPQDLRDASKREIILRRPFSFCDVTVKRNKTIAEILYCVVGPASLRMTTLSAGDSVSVIGPLGNGFSMPKGKKTVLLLAGGMGAPPLLHLAKIIRRDYPKAECLAFAGAKTKEELPFKLRLDKASKKSGLILEEFAKYKIKSFVSTDDGSAGYTGFVTDCLAQWLDGCGLKEKDLIIYGCGPETMLARAAEIARERKIDCQVSMERMMACGIGLCQSCAVECKIDGSGETIYKMCCKDGPVFDSRELVFEK